MGFFDKVKDAINKFKEENKGFGAAMKRINSSGFCGNVNRGIKDGDFWNGSYLSVENGQCVIYGSNQADYFFGGSDVESLEQVSTATVMVTKGNEQLPANRFIINFKDGKRAQADILVLKISEVKLTLGL